MIAWPAWFASSWALWLVLAGSLSASELVTGAAVAAVAASVATAVRNPAVRARDLLAEARGAARGLLPVPADVWRLVVVLGREIARRPSRGAFEVEAFDAGEDTDPRALARRALVPLGRSLSPNEYVVGIDADAGLMLVHRLSG
jgi:hypothetical protein